MSNGCFHSVQFPFPPFRPLPVPARCSAMVLLTRGSPQLCAAAQPYPTLLTSRAEVSAKEAALASSSKGAPAVAEQGPAASNAARISAEQVSQPVVEGIVAVHHHPGAPPIAEQGPAASSAARLTAEQVSQAVTAGIAAVHHHHHQGTSAQRTTKASKADPCGFGLMARLVGLALGSQSFRKLEKTAEEYA